MVLEGGLPTFLQSWARDRCQADVIWVMSTHDSAGHSPRRAAAPLLLGFSGQRQKDLARTVRKNAKYGKYRSITRSHVRNHSHTYVHTHPHTYTSRTDIHIKRYTERWVFGKREDEKGREKTHLDI